MLTRVCRLRDLNTDRHGMTETVYRYVADCLTRNRQPPAMRRMAHDLYLTEPSVNYQLQKLARQGRLSWRRDGRRVIYQLEAGR